MSGRLTAGFSELVEIHWSELVAMEQNESGNNFDSIVTTLARACIKGNLRAIQTALDRLDGKIAMEIEVEYPKFYTVYPNATKTVDDSHIIDVTPQKKTLIKKVLENLPTPTEPEELPTGSLRAVLERMLDSPKKTVVQILEAAEAIDEGSERLGDPLVKSVIIAGLMKLVHEGRMGAVLEVLDQVDGRIADKIKLLGGDVYMKNYATIAPAGATKNEDGFYQIESDIVTNAWAAKLGDGKR